MVRGVSERGKAEEVEPGDAMVTMERWDDGTLHPKHVGIVIENINNGDGTGTITYSQSSDYKPEEEWGKDKVTNTTIATMTYDEYGRTTSRK